MTTVFISDFLVIFFRDIVEYNVMIPNAECNLKNFCLVECANLFECVP